MTKRSFDEDYQVKHDALEAEYFEPLEGNLGRQLRPGKSLLEFTRLHQENSREHIRQLIKDGQLDAKRMWGIEDRI